MWLQRQGPGLLQEPQAPGPRQGRRLAADENLVKLGKQDVVGRRWASEITQGLSKSALLPAVHAGEGAWKESSCPPVEQEERFLCIGSGIAPRFLRRISF